MKDLWIPALTKPNEDHYTLVLKESQPIDFGQVIMWVLVGSVVGGIASTIAGVINDAIFGTQQSPFAQGCGALIGGFLGFFISVGLIYGTAKLFGGNGSFTEQGFLTATWQVPLVLVNSALTIIPIVGPLLALLLSLYAIYLNVLTVKVVHQFEWPKAFGVVILPTVVFVVCICGFFITLLATTGAVGEIFAEIERSLQP